MLNPSGFAFIVLKVENNHIPSIQMKKIRGEELDIIHKVVESGVNTWGNPAQLC